MEQVNQLRDRKWLLVLLVGAVALASSPDPRDATVAQEQAKAVGPLGKFLTLPSTIDDGTIARVRRVGLELQARAKQEERKAVLVLEITPGTSQFHNVQGLAKFLVSGLPGLKTVAWIPADVTGNNVITALACNDIVMQPDAVLGDVGLGQPVDLDERSFVENLANRRHNNKVNSALVVGMMDPQIEVIQVTVGVGAPPNETTETRLMLLAEYKRLEDEKRVIHNSRTIKNAGRIGSFSGSEARDNGFLVAHTAQSRAEIVELYSLPREAMREDPTAGKDPKVRLIKIEGEIEPFLGAFVIREIKRAVASGANILIFEIDSGGGRLDVVENIAYTALELDPKKIKTVAYVPKEAFSGAAIIALACDEIYVHADARFGDAGAIQQLEPGGQFHWVPEKQLGPLKELLHDLATKKGRPPALALAMTIKETVVFEAKNRDTGQVWYMTEDEIHAAGGEWIQGAMVPETGNNQLLTVSGLRAHELLLAEAPVPGMGELKQRLGISAETEVIAVGRTWVDTLVFILNTPAVATLLIVLGILALYIEAHVPSGLFGICSGVCFALFFWSRFLGGTAGWLEVVLFAAGIICLVLELFVIPGFGVFGISGILLMLSSLVLASQTFVIPHSSADYTQLTWNLGSLAVAVLGVIVSAVLLSRVLPKMPFLSQMILTPGGEVVLDGPQLAPEYLEEGGLLRVGDLAKTQTILRPAGKALFNDELIDVVSDGPYIDKGRTVQVVEVAGNRIVVSEVGSPS